MKKVLFLTTMIFVVFSCDVEKGVEPVFDENTKGIASSSSQFLDVQPLADAGFSTLYIEYIEDLWGFSQNLDSYSYSQSIRFFRSLKGNVSRDRNLAWYEYESLYSIASEGYNIVVNAYEIDQSTTSSSCANINWKKVVRSAIVGGITTGIYIGIEGVKAGAIAGLPAGQPIVGGIVGGVSGFFIGFVAGGIIGGSAELGVQCFLDEKLGLMNLNGFFVDDDGTIRNIQDFFIESNGYLTRPSTSGEYLFSAIYPRLILD